MYRELAVALTRIEQLESELAIVKCDLAAANRPRFDWGAILVGVVLSAGVFFAISMLLWGA
jgi:hypothetical protein